MLFHKPPNTFSSKSLKAIQSSKRCLRTDNKKSPALCYLSHCPDLMHLLLTRYWNLLVEALENIGSMASLCNSVNNWFSLFELKTFLACKFFLKTGIFKRTLTTALKKQRFFLEVFKNECRISGPLNNQSPSTGAKICECIFFMIISSLIWFRKKGMSSHENVKSFSRQTYLANWSINTPQSKELSWDGIFGGNLTWIYIFLLEHTFSYFWWDLRNSLIISSAVFLHFLSNSFSN